MGVILDFFFDSTARTLVIYREFWYFSRIFPTWFSQLISIFMSLLHTFSKGVKIDARLPRSERFASIMRSGVLLRPPVSAGVLEPLKKMGGTPGLKKVNELVYAQNVTTPIFVMVLVRLRVPQEAERTQLRIMEANRSLLGSHASVFTPIENVWRRLMNMLMSWENKVGKIREKHQNSL